ncbi:class I SAM-dependent methyltransferase [Actinokineospora diospyrosa]|uniref:Methyltransferase domain-containing protein n=1 Tax=Actinokineospora diospyrosa TaxID=103728 RepID=A0ABT1IMB2_9PSEU|nr:class I SAM-dependent methyltransferase [Actinokineospora diospyrosa]MCP2273788.1 Methyltransferase domain-containing protein [Actinokineospora diospyrosa]
MGLAGRGLVARARERLATSLRAAEVVPSPNIWHWPGVYEAENRAQDADGAVWALLDGLADWTGDVLDVGCGDGFHLPRFAERAATVLGVEPHPPLVERAKARIGGVPRVAVALGSAQDIPVADASADVVHARTAYFFGPGCEPGLREADRVLRPGGALVVVDLDAAAPPYGRWMRADLPDYDTGEVDRFFEISGFDRHRVATTWRFPDRETLEAVLRIEFSAPVAARAIADTPGLEFSVGYRVLVRRKPRGLIVG